MARFQIAPEVEFKLDFDLPDIDANTPDHEVQQHKAAVYEEFKRRLEQAFPEGFRIHSLEFGLDTGWHEELKGR